MNTARTLLALPVLAAALLLPLAATAAASRYLAHPVPAGAAALPFSDAVVQGDTLYVGGHIGIDPATGNAAADPDAEARAMMEAVRHTLHRAGLSMDDLVR